jgi:lipopolysaccharide export system protein LptC
MTADTRRRTIGAPPQTRPLSSMSRRYSRFVRLMKIVLPVAAATLIAAVLAWPTDRDKAPDFQLSLMGLERTEAGELGMSKGRFIGTDTRNQPYVITAEAARPDGANSMNVTLHTLQADLSMQDGTWLSVTAPSGHFDRTAEQLRLAGPVDIFSSNGFELHTPAATVDMKTGTASGDSTVEATGPMGNLRAQSFRFERAGQRYFFTGNVRLVVRPGQS